jgi:hypothetical protein
VGETIDEIYVYIADAAAQNMRDFQRVRFNIEIRYNKQYHYPEFCRIAPKDTDNVGVSGYVKIEITEFEPLGEVTVPGTF